MKKCSINCLCNFWFATYCGYGKWLADNVRVKKGKNETIPSKKYCGMINNLLPLLKY